MASGVDGVTVQEFESSLGTHLAAISCQLRERSYKFQPSRRVAIPKGSGNGTRDIHVFTVRDKIVQQAIQGVLLTKKKSTSLFPEVYNAVAIAYIPKLNGVKCAVDKVKLFYSANLTCITNLDIQNFFDNIPGKLLFDRIVARLPDHSIDWIIKDTIRQKIYSVPDDVDRVLQGAVLAPLYSNIYLSDFDAFLIANNIAAVRFADDLAIFTKTEADAVVAKVKVREGLKSLAKMEFYPDDHESKAPKTKSLNRGADFLGIRFHKGARTLVIGPAFKKIKSEKQKITDIFLRLISS